jgi:hypothetical protein
MTPAAVRQAIGQQYFSVLCDACHGKMFHDGVLCSKCDGEGRLVIAEPRVRPPMSENGKFAVILAAAIGIIFVTLLAVLM